jgi:hypothetical protein
MPGMERKNLIEKNAEGNTHRNALNECRICSLYDI